MNRSRDCFLLSLAFLSLPVLAQDTVKEPPSITAVRKRVPKIKAELEKLRGLKFKAEVGISYQTAEDFKAYVETQLDTEIPQRRVPAIGRLYHRLGLVPEGFDMRRAFTELLASQALAYYAPEKDRFFILNANQPEMMLDPTVLHEFHHALQDQYFDLAAMTKKLLARGDDDPATAFKFLIEGEATYLTIAYSGVLAGIDPQAALGQIGMIAGLSREELSRLERQQLGMMDKGGKELEESLKKRDATPYYLYRMLVDPYYKGAAMVKAVHDHGGWDAVTRLYEKPPSSTEQVLHPEKLYGERDDPVIVTLPDLSASFGDGYVREEKNCIGEIGLQTIFHDQTGSHAEQACAGWDGDRVATYARREPVSGEVPSEAKAAMVWLLEWDSEDDARQFAVAYKKLMFKKYDVPAVKSVDRVIRFDKGGEEHLITLRGLKVLIIEGAPIGRSAAVMEAAFEGARSRLEGAEERPGRSKQPL